MSLIDVICVAGDVRPMKAQDILDTTAMQWLRELARRCADGENVDRHMDNMPLSILDWINDPEQLELPEEFRWKLKTTN